MVLVQSTSTSRLDYTLIGTMDASNIWPGRVPIHKMVSLASLLVVFFGITYVVEALPATNASSQAANFNPHCFPAVGFNMPSSVPSSLDGWWCNRNDEYGFIGFSYSVAGCQSLDALKRDFKDIRNTFNGRYVRMYGTCDRPAFYNDVVNAAWEAGVGIHALIWFGFNGDNAWQGRKSRILATMNKNPKAKFVTRVVQFGSEPLYDWAIEVNRLASEIWSLKGALSGIGVPVTVSDMAYGYQIHDGAQAVMNAIDIIDAHILPFFSYQASTALNCWSIVQDDLNWFFSHGQGKKIYLSENGWPSTTTSEIRANSANAVANIQNEANYYNLLDSKCQYFKSVPGGGIGWFAHLYSDSQQLGYGIYDTQGHLKFPFRPRTSC